MIEHTECCECAKRLELEAAYLWRQENPEMSVFDCSLEMKESYRRRVLAGERAYE